MASGTGSQDEEFELLSIKDENSQSPRDLDVTLPLDFPETFEELLGEVNDDIFHSPRNVASAMTEEVPQSPIGDDLWSAMTDEVAESLQESEQLSDLTIGDSNGIISEEGFVIVKSTYSPVEQYEITYAWQFPISEAEMYYYYNLPPHKLRDGKPELQGSDWFDGPLKTKWSVTSTFHRWIETRRWVTMYLSRWDLEDTPQLSLQCEFRVVDKNGNVLRSMSSKFNPTFPLETRGFTRFIPFNEIRDVLDGNLLRIEAHIIFLVNLPSQSAHEDVGQGFGNEDYRMEMDFAQFIPDDDKVEILVDKEFVGIASRANLLEQSDSYRYLADNTWWNKINIDTSILGATDVGTVQQCIQYLHEQTCEYLRSGSYDNMTKLLSFATMMKIRTLECDCISEMSRRCEIGSAALHAELLKTKGYHRIVELDALEHFRKFFRENIREIKKTDSFQALMETDFEYFTRLAVDPKLHLFLEGGRQAGEANEVFLLD